MTAQLASKSLPAKRIIAVLLLLIGACLLAVSAMTQQANAKPWGAIEYSIQGDHVRITGFNTDHAYTVITVPESIEGLPVTEIQYGAFRQNSTWTKVTINAKVTSLPDVCFYKCPNLKEVVLPETITTLGSYSFYGCENLTSVTGATKLEEIGEKAFFGCTSLPSFSMPESLAGIGTEAFYGCKNLTSIDIPKKVAVIMDGAFKSCSSLSTVTLNVGLKTIGANAFDSCKSLTTIEIPESVTTIGDKAFNYATGLESTNLPRGLKALGENAFAYCTKLSTIGPFPENLEHIGSYVFSNCALTYIALPDTVTELPMGMFFACSKLESIALPDTLKSIGKYAFDGCRALEYLRVPKSVTAIGNYAFGNLQSAKMIFFENGNMNWAGALVFRSHMSSAPTTYPNLTVVCANGDANGNCETEVNTLGATFKKLSDADTYTLTHNSNGGSGMMGDVTLPKGFAYAVPLCKFTKPSADFKCWKTGSTECDPGKALPASSSAVTVYAQWSDWGAGNGYTVEPQTNGGSGTMPSFAVKKGTAFTAPICTFTPPAEKTFGWWRYSLGGVNYDLQEGSERDPGNVGTVFLKAQWVGQYTVTFDARGGTVNPGTMKTNGEGRLDSWPTAKRDGYVFEGWSTTDDYGGLTSLARVYTGDTTLYAIWISQAEADTSGGDVSGGSGGGGSGTTPISMNRLYNPNSGEHFYTADDSERDYLVSLGWNYEGEGWKAPSTSSTPVYRLYNANGGEHHYTMDASEKDFLVSVGWNYESIGWYSDDAKTVPLFREYNPNAFANNHNYTTNSAEHEWLLSLGWQNEGYAWYGV